MEIYSVTNDIDGKQYIGQTKHTAQDRWSDHLYDARNGSPYLLHRAIRKYGPENFSIRTVWCAEDFEKLNELEVLFIAAYRTLAPNGYNLDDGGHNRNTHPDTSAKLSARNMGNTYNLGKHDSDATKKKKSDAMKGRKPSPITIAASIAFHTDRPLSDEHKEKISDALVGNKNMIGRQHKLETKQKISDSLIGNKRSLGHKQTPEHKANIRASRLATQERKRLNNGY